MFLYCQSFNFVINQLLLKAKPGPDARPGQLEDEDGPEAESDAETDAESDAESDAASASAPLHNDGSVQEPDRNSCV